VAKQFTGLKAVCELMGVRTYDRPVGYCKSYGSDFGKYIIDNASCVVWEKFDVWDRY